MINGFLQFIKKQKPKAFRDNRLYAAELEHLNDHFSEFFGQRLLEVDWVRTGKDELALQISPNCFYDSILKKEAQENLVAYFAYLLFEKKVFVSFFDSFVQGEGNQVFFTNFDCVSEVSPPLLSYAFAFADSRQLPNTQGEKKLQKALLLLEGYCPEVFLLNHFEQYSYVLFKSELSNANDSEYLEQLQKDSLFFEYSQVDLPPAKNFAYLLDSSRHKNDPRHRKSTVFYWLPLLVLIYVLYRFF